MKTPVKMASHYLKHRLNRLHPFEVQALLLNACNLKCVYCRYPELKTDLLSTEQWFGILGDLARVGTVRIKFQGGEPTLRKDFCEISTEAKRLGMITAVITNGTQIAKDPTLADHLDEIVVSVDSPVEKTHDSLRGDGSFSKAMKCIDVSQAKGKKTYVVMVVTKKNYGDIAGMVQFCEERNLKMHAQPLMLGKEPFDETSRPLALSDSESRELHQRLALWKKQSRPLMFSSESYARAGRWRDFSQTNILSSGNSKCMAGKYYIHIEANGDVWPCGHHGANFVAKNIVRDGFEEALRNSQVHDCADCPVAYLNERKALFNLKPQAVIEFLRRG